MSNAVLSSTVTPGTSPSASASKIAELSQKASALRLKLIRGQKADASAEAAPAATSPPDTVSQQLVSIEAQINRLILTSQLSTIGAAKDASGKNAPSDTLNAEGGHASPKDAAKEAAKLAAGTVHKPGQPGQPATATGGGPRTPGTPDPYQPPKAPGGLVDLSS